jgi:hypothetical protein
MTLDASALLAVLNFFVFYVFLLLYSFTCVLRVATSSIADVLSHKLGRSCQLRFLHISLNIIDNVRAWWIFVRVQNTLVAAKGVLSAHV